MVRLRCQPADVILVSVYLPHDGRTNPCMQEVLDDLVSTAKAAFGKKRVVLVVGGDLNAQLPRGIIGRTGRWCVRAAGNAKGQRCLKMMDSLDLFAASTGNCAAPRRRGGACTYSVQEKSRTRTEKRCQLDYVMISAAFRSIS